MLSGLPNFAKVLSCATLDRCTVQSSERSAWVYKKGFGRSGRHAETLERFTSQSFGKTFGGLWKGSKQFS